MTWLDNREVKQKKSCSLNEAQEDLLLFFVVGDVEALNCLASLDYLGKYVHSVFTISRMGL